ncbi:NifZ family protein [Novosphingobium sp. Rr 2-17]|uniref:nitrogen fixation protein NifZ n=1 Tax=Novosphingobium sp. Rr 2-17 TaxID=555793 RepID=UPI000269A244|nr:nitrogen fixation protein NifZ [Novosphingobium sp. Rr 2-17]EIZ77320.1 NifZ family protein [Novosphingobium sp. Rr 2-17]
MFDLRQPIYHVGQVVRAATDLVNDGSHPDAPVDALLVPVGTGGEIVNVGHHGESNTPIYLVDFEARVVIGCFEEELEPA